MIIYDIKLKMPNKNIAWYKRWDEFINICKTKNVECLDSKEVL